MRLEHGRFYDYQAQARVDLCLPKRVVLNDVTLREGLQAAQRPTDSRAKLELGLLIDQAGLPQIQVGYLGRSESDRQTLVELRAGGVKAKLEGICSIAGPSWRDEVETACSVSPDWLNLVLPASDTRLAALNLGQKEILERAVKGISFARDRCAHICYSPVDATRTDLGFLRELVDATTQAGAERFYLIDTAGTISPVGMRYLAREMCHSSKTQLAVHCHDDLGLAVANGLAAVEQGVEVVDVCINGLGKRAGNLALEEIALALTFFHEFDLGLELDRLYGLSQFAAQVTGVPVPKNKALVGRDAFDIQVDAELRGSPGHIASHALQPRVVGHPSALE